MESRPPGENDVLNSEDLRFQQEDQWLLELNSLGLGINSMDQSEKRMRLEKMKKKFSRVLGAGLSPISTLHSMCKTDSQFLPFLLFSFFYVNYHPWPLHYFIT